MGGHDQDSLIGGTDSDTLEGGTGNDTLRGGTGHDDYDGGRGNDWLDIADATGRDAIFFARRDGDDTVSGFDIFRDTLDLTAFGFESFKEFAERTNVGTAKSGAPVLSFQTGESITFSDLLSLEYVGFVL